MQQLHILFLIDVLYTRHGGGENVLWKMTRMLPADRYRCSVATFASRPHEVAAGAFDCPVHLLPIQRTYDWQAIKMAFRLSRLIREEQVSIVHSFFPTSDLFGGLIAKLSGCPILVSSRRDMGFQRSFLHRLAYRMAGGMFDQVQAVSESVRREHIRQDRLAPEKVMTVYNGVDLDEIDCVTPRLTLSKFGIEPGAPVIVCVANVRPVKGMDVLVETAARVCREEPKARFLVVGHLQDRVHMDSVMELANRLDVAQKVIFAGRSFEVPSILKMCDVFFLPSHSEGLSNALLEAMACGLPCVATDVGGNCELIDAGRNGYLVPARNAEAAARRILQMLRSPDEARRMGLAGRQIVESRFSVEAMIARISSLYEGLLEEAGETVMADARYGRERV